MSKEKDLIERFNEQFGVGSDLDNVCFTANYGEFGKCQKTVRDFIHDFLLTELQALKKEVIGEWKMRECDIDKNTGEVEQWKADFKMGYDNKNNEIKEVFGRWGIK